MSRIRPIALCLFSHGGRILVNQAYDPVKDLNFCRPIGGGIEFGETGVEAIRREVLEELGARITQVAYVGTLENIFTYLGEPGHELVMVFDARFEDSSLYEQAHLTGTESNGDTFHASWKALSSFHDGLPLFPQGLASLVRSYWEANAV